MAVLVIFGLVIFGDKLPQAAEQVGRAIRQFCEIVNTATTDLKKELGPEFGNFGLSTLNPKTMVREVSLRVTSSRESLGQVVWIVVAAPGSALAVLWS